MQLDDLDFADDLALLSHTHEQLQMKTTSIVAASSAVGLSIHKGESKTLKYDTENTSPITLDGETLIIDEQGGSDADVKSWIGKTKAAFLKLNNIWDSKQLSTNFKVRIFNTKVQKVLL
ncbi:unnamed protein product [Schistosoma curassoni]|uniref:DUF6451 domain-containing protein n=1 Tax=Schistosoma curassoni TaxID=6186 RepID=A0A183JZ86_9TREM|nr:unnamed protein product [Schistosoma curassoni]